MKTSNRFLTAFILIGTYGSIAIGDPPGVGLAPAGSHLSGSGDGTKSTPMQSKTSPSKPDAQGYFYIYKDKEYPQNHFAPSGWMGDFGDLQMDDSSQDNPHEGNTSFKITYSAKASQSANWAGIFWQEPVNNWGDKAGGYDLSHYKKLTYWARGAKGGENISEFKVGGITGENGDSDSASIGPITLTKDWKPYTIDLSKKNLNHIIGGFAWSASRDNNPQGFIIYLDQIHFES